MKREPLLAVVLVVGALSGSVTEAPGAPGTVASSSTNLLVTPYFPMAPIGDLNRTSRSAYAMSTVPARQFSPAAALRDADAAFDDTVGDAQLGLADIRRVVVVNDASGFFAVGVSYANRTCAAGSDLVTVDLDVDQNPTTGSASGAEYLFFLDVPQNQRGVARWNGTIFDVISVASFRASCDPSGFDSWDLRAADIGVTTGFSFYVSTCLDRARTQCGDIAPNALPLWNYQLSTPPPPPPPPRPPPPPPPPEKTYQDAPRLPSRITYVGKSVKHVRLGEKLYRTMKSLGSPKVVAVACWSKGDWPSVLESAGGLGEPGTVTAGFFRTDQRRWLHVAPKQCADIQALINTRALNGQRAYALTTVLHERVHADGYRNEAQTNCYGVQLVYGFARELNFVPRLALRLEQLAVRKARGVAPRGYWDSARCSDGGEWDLFSERNLSY